MKTSRRKFIRQSAVAGLGLSLTPSILKADIADKPKLISKKNTGPLVISTWRHGMAANEAAWKVLSENGRALDAVEQGVRITESDPECMSVGYGGLPDRDGFVTLDACIMDETGNCGSVSFLQNIKNPISVARLVMEKTPHVMLSGEGAFEFAQSKGFKKENLLTEKAREAWLKWKRKSNYEPVINVENHDTIGMIALDKSGNISGACTTSGIAFKYHGRVGDSPIIGAGMFVDNEVGGAVATGTGELVMKTLGTFLVVELMRNGMSPQEACVEAVKRIANKIPDYEKFQIGYLAINKSGDTGAYCIQKGFNYALYQDDENKLIDSDFYLKE
ncbi:MAG: N(4)-(beta-N-acetylglucosaminyl)-L-asparaginase [Bacteroidales bacterium]|nr:N(4)-(beta-N-acetylglucosaminyl)-L-asparaginase [Bacteroidales bacterium]